MGMERYFRATSYALIATGFAALALTGEISALPLAAYAIAFCASLYADVRGITRLRPKEWMWRVLAILYIPFLVFDALFLNDKVIALVHLTLFLSASKLLQNKRDRDWVMLYLIAFFQMLLCANLTINAAFVASLAVFLFFLISTLAAFEIRRSRAEVKSSDEEIIHPARKTKKMRATKSVKKEAIQFPGRSRYLLGASMVQVCLVALLTLPFFFLIPRFGSGNLARGFGDGEGITGFSETVQLGDVASIKTRQRVVMRVGLKRSPGRWLRWRGVALNHYENSSWSLTKDNRAQSGATTIRQEIKSSAGDDDQRSSNRDRTYTFDNTKRVERENLLEQTIILENINTNVLFAAYRPIQLIGNLSSLTHNPFTSALSSNELHGRTQYTIWSDITLPDEQTLRIDSEESYTDDVTEVYLQRPKNLDPRIRQLALEITRGKSTAYDKARAIEQYLKGFAYSLDLKQSKSDPLAEFLFETREGHCEYFATAMTIMLRTIGIPARVVNGFQMGEYNDISKLWVVRESDAHSWVEVSFPNIGWVEFDPTPPAGINDYMSSGLMALARKYFDALEVFWIDYVVTLDSQEQTSIMLEMQSRLRALKDEAYRYYASTTRWMKKTASNLIVERRWSITSIVKTAGLMITLALSLMAVYVLIAHRKRRRFAPTGYGPWWHRLFIVPLWRRKKMADSNHTASAILFYEEMLSLTSRAGMVKPPDQTPVEFAQQSGYDQVREITEIYNRVRFGGARLGESEIRSISKLLAGLKQTIRHRRADRGSFLSRFFARFKTSPHKR